ncbi:hypothetical protein YTPLAS18_20620 [Nitrospira sp.]|nr:hypothetical protein YTPLAS18_20620 [Nitrospira sp.]
MATEVASSIAEGSSANPYYYICLAGAAVGVCRRALSTAVAVTPRFVLAADHMEPELKDRRAQAPHIRLTTPHMSVRLDVD